MNQIILDTSVSAADALKKKDIQINISSADNININGTQSIPYGGSTKDFTLDYYYNQRVSELQTMLSNMAAGAEKTKLQAKVDAAVTYLAAIEAATTTYMQTIYALENPAEV